jgi:AcrR family transcriptional regulator
MSDRGGTPKGERVSRQILDATIEVLAEHGTAGASLQRIADRAGVDKRTPAYYFGDRDGLLRATAVHLGDQLLPAIEETVGDITDPGASLAAGLELVWSTVVARPTLHRAHLELVSAAACNGFLREEIQAVRDRFHAMIRTRAVAAEEAGWVWLIDKDAVSELVISTVQGLTIDYLLRGETTQLRGALGALPRVIGSLVRPA